MRKFYPLLACVLLFACSENDKENRPSVKDISFMDIMDAKALILSNPNTRSSDGGSGIYKVLDSGVIQEVNTYDESGELLTSEIVYPTAIYNTPSEFVIFAFDQGREFVVVSRNTGKAHFLQLASISGVYYFGTFTGKLNDFVFSTDRSGNLYMLMGSNMEGKSQVYRINKNNMSFEQLTPDVYNVDLYCVDSNGNMAFNSDKGFVLLNSGGSFITLDEWEVQNANFWIDGSGFFKAFAVPEESSSANLITLTFNGSQVIVSAVEPLTEAMGWAYTAQTRVIIDGVRFHRCSQHGKTAALNCSTNTAEIVDGELFYAYEQPPFEAKKGYYNIETHTGKCVLTAWSPYADINKLYVYWEQPENTDYISATVSKDGTAYVNLFSRTEASHVVYKVSQKGNAEILKNEVFSNIREMTAIN